MASKPHSDDGTQNHRDWGGRLRRATLISVSTLLLYAAPVAAQDGQSFMDSLGTDLGSNGGGTIMFLIWAGAAILLMAKGMGRIYTAADHMGSLHEDKRRQGREEVRQGGFTFVVGLLGVPAAALVLGRILPDAWSWLGVDISGYFTLGGGGGGGDSGSAGMIYVPVDEIATTSVDTAMLVLPALV